MQTDLIFNLSNNSLLNSLLFTIIVFACEKINLKNKTLKLLPTHPVGDELALAIIFLLKNLHTMIA